VVFSVNHLGYSRTRSANLRIIAASFTFDTEDPDQVECIEVTINTASIDLADQKWDDHLKGADFFNVEKFPTMTFKSTKIEKTGDKTANITGDLTLLGVTKTVTLVVTHEWRRAFIRTASKLRFRFLGDRHAETQ
jgi:polyisoprenoid-binding protein YceI